MNRKRKAISLNKLMHLYLVSTMFLWVGCQKNDTDIIFPNSESREALDINNLLISENITSEVIKEFTITDILAIKSYLDDAGISIPDLIFPQTETSARGIINDVLLSAIKVTTKSTHPGDPTRQIDLSGVLLVPKITLTSLRLVVAPVPTFLADSQAPSNVFANDISLIQDGALNFLYFWSLQAYQGFAVLLPDYPGFGDSYQQCFVPYMVQKPMITAAIDLTKATQDVMTSKGYRYKPELIITGFSQGAYVATSLTRELELNPTHGLDVSLLVAGGTPANLEYIVNTIRQSEEYTYPLIVPYLMCGFQSNGYPDIDFSNIFKEPYSSESEVYSYFDGTHTDLGNVFPETMSEFLTEDAINNWETSTNLTTIKMALSENSIQPWVNQCKMVLVHGKQDVTVFHQNAKNFADQQNEIGGNVTFHSVLGDHTISAAPYYLYASANLLLYK
ncbi:MAG: hypothetical protein LUH22_09425 [Bacteroides sp.]|nr:hypothetical protein [Bacteroides sp.]